MLSINKNIFFLIVVVFCLSGCVGPESKKAKLTKNAEPCLSGIAELDKALACLNKKGFKEWREYKNTMLFNSCGMYWGYPLVASCSYISIEHEGNTIKFYSLKAELDGV